MGLIERMRADLTEHAHGGEQRVIGGVPWRPWDSPFWKFSQGGPVHPSRAFYGVDRALGLPALYSCVRLLAESLASLPLKIYTKAPNGSAHRYWGPSILDRPSASANIYDWLYQIMTSLLLHGNAWGMITGRDGYGYPTGIELLDPAMVTVIDDPQQPWNTMRTRVYLYGRQIQDWRQDMFHIRAMTIPGRTEGITPLRAFAMTVMNGLEAQRYGTDWFASGGFPPGTFQNNELEIDPDQAAQIREDTTAAIRNREVLVYGRDWDYKPVVVPPSEAQMIEALQMNATQLAAVYGLPPDRVGGRRGDSLTYNTVEQSTLQVIEALRPWLVRLENAFFDILPANRYCRFNPDAMLKTDLKTRTEIYASQRAFGMRSIDEIRDMEDLEPYPGGIGDEHIPLEVMVAMSRSIRGIPNSMKPQITLEMDLAAAKLEKLQAQGVAQPDVMPAAPSPSQLYAGNLGTVRGVPDTDRVTAIVEEILARKAAANDLHMAPEYLGPWIPSDDDMARLSPPGYPGNGNGNGRH